MKKFTKGLLTGIGAGIITGIGTSVMVLMMTERESIRIEDSLGDTMSDLVDYLKTEEGEKNKHLLADLAGELTELGEIRISKVFKNLAKAMELEKTSKEKIKELIKDNN